MNEIYKFPSGLRLAYKYSPAVRSVGIAVMTAVGSGNETAKNNGAEKVFLEVRVSNATAMSLYLKGGFKGVYARTRYYRDGVDCLVMSKKL